jgi:hypothetical protein
MLTRLNDNSEFYVEDDQWENNVFASNEGTKENQVQGGNDNVNKEKEEDGVIDQEVRGKETIVTRSGRTVKKPSCLEGCKFNDLQ